MMTTQFERSRGVSNASFRRRSRLPSRAGTTDAESTIEEAVTQISEKRHTNVTRTFANVLEAIGAIGFCASLYLFFRDKALALRVLIGSSITAGIGVLVNLGITVKRKIRERRGA